MKFIILKKNHLIFILLSIIILLICISCYSIYASNTKIITDEVKEKIYNIYNSNEKIAYLTFDDGPTKKATEKVLDVLKENNVKANFFVIGYRVEEFPELIKREYEEGHFIANHTYSHNNSKIYSSKQHFIDEINKTDQAISNAIGKKYVSHIFRFPNGSSSKFHYYDKKKCFDYLDEIDYYYLDWNALNSDSLKKYSSSQLLQNLKKSIKNKNTLVILMHDTKDVSNSSEALDSSIKFLKEQGYEFRTFDYLLTE